MAVANGVSNIHETGQPDTPVEVLTDILGRATQEQDVGKLRALVEQASKLVSGLDPYLEVISTPASPVSCYLSLEVAEHRFQHVLHNSLVGMPILLHTGRSGLTAAGLHFFAGMPGVDQRVSSA